MAQVGEGALPALGKMQQNFNATGLRLFFRVLGGERALVIPHISVPDIRWVKWPNLRAAGFKGCVFDKDNTLTTPYGSSVAPEVAGSLRSCIDTFAGKVVLYSNSAGLSQFDPEGKEAEELERRLGLHVLRHVDKKPGGGCEELTHYFGCGADELVMVGDRYLTDVAFGNRHGMLTIYCRPLVSHGEPVGVRVARGVENFFLKQWIQQGAKAPLHRWMPPEALTTFVTPPELGGQTH